MTDDKQRLEALADAAGPAPTQLRREHEIRRAIDAGLAAPAAAQPRRAWLWGMLGAATAAAAALAIWFGTRSTTGALVVEQGAIAAVETGRFVEVAAHDHVVLRTPDDSTVEASELTRFERDDRAATRWHLDRGHLASHVTKRAPGQTFEIATPEATVAVVGTRFSVDRAVIDGVATTRVHVDEGIVRVTPTGGAPVMLHAGEQWPAATQTAANRAGGGGGGSDGVGSDGIGSDGIGSDGVGSGSGGGVTVGVVERPAPPHDPIAPIAPPAHPARPFDASTIRKTIRAGHLADARQLIDAGRKAAHAAPDLAELGILAAEAELAGRATRTAIDLYLAVVRDYPATPQAEQALFAAAQLAFDRPDAGYRPDAILRDYLDTYPRGQFAGDARRLLDRAKN